MLTRTTFMLALSAVVSGASSTVALGAALPKNRLTGIIVSVSGNTMVVRNRAGNQVTVDLTEAMANGHVGVLAPNLPVELHGTYLSDGSFHCVFTSHSSYVPRDWEGDQ